MATNTVTASIVINFTTAGGEGILAAEIDDRETGYNGGDTNFTPGSTPVFLLYTTSNVIVDLMSVSEGSLALVSNSVLIDSSEYLTYAQVKSATPQHPIAPASGVVVDSAGVVGSPIITEASVSFAAAQIAVLKLSYKSYPKAYRLVGASGLRPVVIYIAGHTA